MTRALLSVAALLISAGVASASTGTAVPVGTDAATVKPSVGTTPVASVETIIIKKTDDLPPLEAQAPDLLVPGDGARTKSAS